MECVMSYVKTIQIVFQLLMVDHLIHDLPLDEDDEEVIFEGEAIVVDEVAGDDIDRHLADQLWLQEMQI